MDKYQHFIDISPDFVFESHIKTFRFTNVNSRACEFYGYSHEEFLNMTIFDVEDKPMSESEVSNIYNNSAIGTVMEIDGNHRTKAGTSFPVNIRFSKINEEYVIANVRDITSLKKFEQVLERKNKELEEFAHIVSHDLKSPLRGISSLATWIKEDIDRGSTDVGEKLNLLKLRVKRLNGFVSGILDYSRIGRSSLKFEKVKLNELVEEISENFASINDHVRFNIKRLPQMMGYPMFFDQLFSNLIANAIEHTDKEKCKIVISARRKGHMMTFCVSDNGPGIPENMQERVFQIFQVLDRGEIEENTGVGLSIVRKIIRELEGKVWVQNNKKEGCSVFLEIPIIDSPEQKT